VRLWNDSNGRLLVYGVIRQVGPLLANKLGHFFADPEWAESLFLALKASVKPSGNLSSTAPRRQRAVWTWLTQRHDISV